MDGVGRRVFYTFTIRVQSGAVERSALLLHVEEVLGSGLFSESGSPG
jgi:hypothetical protein